MLSKRMNYWHYSMFIEKHINIVSTRSLLTLYNGHAIRNPYRKEFAGKIDSWRSRIKCEYMRLISVKCKGLYKVTRLQIVSAFGMFAWVLFRRGRDCPDSASASPRRLYCDRFFHAGSCPSLWQPSAWEGESWGGRRIRCRRWGGWHRRWWGATM